MAAIQNVLRHPKRLGRLSTHSTACVLVLFFLHTGGKFCFFKCKILIPTWLVSEYFPRGCRLPVFPESYGM